MAMFSRSRLYLTETRSSLVGGGVGGRDMWCWLILFSHLSLYAALVSDFSVP